MADSAPQAWRCSVCGCLHGGAQPPAECPVFGAPADRLEALAEESAPHPHAAAAARVVAVGAGVEVNQGIVVDNHLASSHPSILAAGDVAEHRSLLYGSWTASRCQGSIAGAILLGDTAAASPLKKAIETRSDFSGLLGRRAGAAEILAHLRSEGV